MEDQSQSIYAWERGAARLWETVQEDQEGNLLTNPARNEGQRKLSTLGISNIRRGLIRYLVVAIDCSASSGDKDYRPTRLEASKVLVGQFIVNYFDQNPISQLSLCITRAGIAEQVTHMSASAKNHINKLKSILRIEGLASLQNILRVAMISLQHVPEYGQREVLIVFSSLSTVDPEDIFQTVEEAKHFKVRVSIICLAAEVYVCRRITELTSGVFAVARDYTHLMELLMQQTVPLPDASRTDTKTAEFLYVGFPKRSIDVTPQYTFDGNSAKLLHEGYACPRCLTKTSQLPAQCNVCSLQLNSSAHIARSFHHLFPVPPYQELQLEEATSCFGCQSDIDKGDAKFGCTSCTRIFCFDCDLFIHETLHNCPGCIAGAAS